MSAVDRRARSVEQAAAVGQMRADPGRLVHVGTYRTRQSARSLSYALRAGQLAAFRGTGPFEAEVRETANGFDVWARYVGAPVEPTVTVTVAQVEAALHGYLNKQFAADFGLPPDPADLRSEALDLFARLRSAAGEPGAETMPTPAPPTPRLPGPPDRARNPGMSSAPAC